MTEKPTTDCAQCAELRERLWRHTYCLSRMLEVSVSGAAAQAAHLSGIEQTVSAAQDLEWCCWHRGWMADIIVQRLGRKSGRG